MAEILKLESGKPVQISLKYKSGKEVRGDIMFTLSDGRILFVPPAGAEAIKELNPAVGEAFIIITQQAEKRITYRVERIPQPKTSAPAKAGSRAASTVQAKTVTPGQKEFYLSRACALVDVFAEAHQYAVKTYNGTLSKEDIRALVTTVFIQLTPKPGGRY